MQRYYNVDEIRTKGYDIAAEYSFDLDNYGRLKFKADMTHVIEHSKTVDSPDGLKTTFAEGDLSSGVFEDKASASVSWYMDEWRVRWSTKFKGSMVADRDRQESWNEYMADNDALCAEQDADCIANPETLDYYNIGSYVKHNLSVSYSMDISTTSTARFFGGVNNIFDDNGDFILGGKGNYSSQYGGGVGRFIYAGAEFRF
jgi:outer membrane receptor protein involved in Fe transport